MLIKINIEARIKLLKIRTVSNIRHRNTEKPPEKGTIAHTCPSSTQEQKWMWRNYNLKTNLDFLEIP